MTFLVDPFLIQVATFEDLKAIKKMDFEVFSFDQMGTDFWEKEISRERVLVTKTGRTVMGFCAYHTVYEDDTNHVTALGVGKSFRRKGLGRALLREALANMPTGVVRLSVRPGSRTAISLYAQEGFVESSSVGQMKVMWKAAA